jgi:hypothetical protein
MKFIKSVVLGVFVVVLVPLWVPVFLLWSGGQLAIILYEDIFGRNS